MNMVLIDKLAKDLKKMKFKGSVVLCGYGEPMLHKDIFQICKRLAQVAFVEVVSNGDTLKSDTIRKLYNSNVNKLLISLYDGPEQVTKFQEMRKESGVPEDFVILRDRWHGADKDYGLKLTNRTGTIKIGNQDDLGTFTYCNYPSYSVLIDWNGDVFLCPQDWQRRITTGNIMQNDFFEIWTGPTLTKYRKNLLKGNRCDSPCTECNAEGTVLGKSHAEEWKKIYNFKD
jgi:radical SAM protein with 4Fe4S-binding SPASM domain